MTEKEKQFRRLQNMVTNDKTSLALTIISLERMHKIFILALLDLTIVTRIFLNNIIPL